MARTVPPSIIGDSSKLRVLVSVERTFALFAINIICVQRTATNSSNAKKCDNNAHSRIIRNETKISPIKQAGQTTSEHRQKKCLLRSQTLTLLWLTSDGCKRFPPIFFRNQKRKKNKREVLPHCYAICLCSLDVYQTKNSSRATAPIFSTF